jgi:hypothetical protein
MSREELGRVVRPEVKRDWRRPALGPHAVSGTLRSANAVEREPVAWLVPESTPT